MYTHTRTRALLLSSPPLPFLCLSLSLDRTTLRYHQHQRKESNAACLTLSTRAKFKLLTFVCLVDLIQAIVTEAREYPPGTQNGQGKRTRHVACCFEFPPIVACICGEIVDF